MLAGLASCADESIALTDVRYPTYERLDTAGYEGYELVWAEEFDQDGRPNPSYWVYDEGYMRNEEAQDYLSDDPRTSRVEGGDLIIEAFKDPHEGVNKWTGEPYHFDYSSAELTTKGKVDFQYGRLDIAAKIPTGRGVWPAFWLRPTNALEGKYAEIDIMEYVWGNNEDHDTYYVTLHTQATNDGLAERWSGNMSSPTLESNYHLYSLVWDEESIQVLFDNEVVCTAEKEEDMTLDYWPFDQPFFLIMNVAVGGGYMWDNLMDKSHPLWIGFATVSIPLSVWWGGSHEMKKKKLAVKNAENTMEDNVQLLVINMENKWNDMNDAYRQIGIALESIAQAEENLRLHDDYYRAGTATMSDLLEAQTLYQDSHSAYVEAYAKYQIKKREYLQAVGQ